MDVVRYDEPVVNAKRNGGVIQQHEELLQKHAGIASVLITC